MDDRIKKYLYDILNSIDAIDEYLNHRRDFNDFKRKVIKRAIEREFEIIGEAIKRILLIDADVEISHSKRIIGLRNHISHAYDSVLDEILWGIIVRHLPLLESEVKTLLEHDE